MENSAPNSPASATGRLPWIDQARGLSMLLVILGHSPIYSGLSVWIYSFHVPLFFFLSGYLYNNDKYPGIRSVFRSRVRTLIVPYGFFTFVGFAFMATRLQLKGQLSSTVAFEALRGSLLGIRDTSDYNGTLWFLPALLVTELIYATLNKLFAGDKRWMFGVSGGLSLLGILVLKQMNIARLAYNADIAIVVLAIFAAGNLARGGLAGREPSRLRQFLTATGLLALSVVLSGRNGWVSAYHFVFGNPALYYLCAAVGISFAIVLSKAIRFRFIEFVGQNSLVFLALHQYLVLFRLYSVVDKLPWKIQDNPWVLPLQSLVFFSLGVGLVAPIAYGMEKWFPRLVGKPARLVRSPASGLSPR